jgi:hypothetical protein
VSHVDPFTAADLAERWARHLEAARAQYERLHAAGDERHLRHDACDCTDRRTTA